jgi:predicted amidohydrolase YtcJ
VKPSLLLCALIAASLPLHAQKQTADLVLQHGVVLTVDAKDSVAQAVAIRDGRIVAVGADADVSGLIGPGTKVIDLAGRTVTPGLIDTHIHLLDGVTDAMYKVELTHAASVAEILDSVKARAEKTPAGLWIEGFGWNEGVIAEHRAPTLAELDAVSAGHPAFLENVTHHYAMVNSTGLLKLGIDAATKSPEGGTIVHGADGKPTGILKEKANSNAATAIPAKTKEQLRKGIQAALDQIHAEGLTGVKDIVSPDTWAAYLSYAKSGGLTAHVCPLMWVGYSLTAQAALEAIQKGRVDSAAVTSGDLTICGAKILLDGSAMGRTAWRNEDYPMDPRRPDVPVGRGYPIVEPAQYTAMVKLFNAAGVPVGTHAIGDRAIDLAVDSYAQALKENPQTGLRHSIIHVHEPTDHALSVMQDMQKKYDAGYPEVQGGFLYFLGDSLPAAFGPEQSQHVLPFATYRKRDIVFAGGSDFPVTPFPPRFGLWASVAREPLKGTFGPHPFGTAESVDVHVALRSYTAWAARQVFLEKETGTIEAGKWADFAVWDRNPYSVPASDLKDMKCTMTLYKGKVVFER